MEADVLFENDFARAFVRRAQANWIIWEARVVPQDDVQPLRDHMAFATNIKDDVFQYVIQPELDRNNQAKVSLSLCLRLERFDIDTQTSTFINHYFVSPSTMIMSGDQLDGFYSTAIAQINRSIECFTRDGSGWRVNEVFSLDINFARLRDNFVRRRGRCLLVPELPSAIKQKYSIVKVAGQQDGDCFYTAILVAAYLAFVESGEKTPVTLSRIKNKSLPAWERLWDAQPEGRPVFSSEERKLNVAIDDIYRFENENALYRVLVLAFEDGKFYPLRTFKYREDYFIPVDKFKVLTLLYHAEHYYPVKSLSSLLNTRGSGKLTGHYLYYCPFCLQGIVEKERYQQHMQFCSGQSVQAIAMPQLGTTAAFSNFQALQKLPFVIYADTESYLAKMGEEMRGRTTLLSKHVPCAAAYYVSISPEMERVLPRLWNLASVFPEYPNNLYKVFVGEDCMTDFLESLYDLTERLWNLNQEINIPLKNKSEFLDKITSTTCCYMCNKPIDFMSQPLTPVLDHDHISGQFRGIAHSKCNARAAWKKRLFPVIFHNWRGYDCHSLCKTSKFSTRNVKIRCIPNTSEKYLSMSLLWKVGEFTKDGQPHALNNELRFIDSFQFLSASLDTLVKQLASSSADKRMDFAAIYRCCSMVDSKDEIFFRKGVYPYSYVDSMDRLKETALPPRKAFTSDLKVDGTCSQKDYDFAQRAWTLLGCQTLEDYMRNYLKFDVLLLADVFDTFRKTCLTIHGLDPVYFYSLPGFSWQAALKSSSVELELLTNYEMHCLLEVGIRGGLSVATRHYTRSKPGRSAIITLDANSLYAWCMTQPLPVSNFRWLESWEDLFPPDNLTLWPADDGETGYILEVDLDYPESIHNETATYPLAPAKEPIRESDLSPFMVDQHRRSRPATANLRTEHKLLATERDKKNYPVHYRTLRLYLELGLVLKKVHRVIAFTQKPWLANYINGNIERRKQATTVFESDFFKKCNNSVFGKTQEKKRARSNFRLTVNEEEMDFLISRPNYDGSTIFSPELVGLYMKKTRVCLDQPIFSGFTVLDLSKYLMFEFFYKHLKPCFSQEGDRVEVIYTDTDSFHLLLKSFDCQILEKLLPIRDSHLDGSNLPKDHVLYNTCNKGVMGMFKEETGGAHITEHVALRPKMYAILTESGEEKRRAKGVKKDIINNQLTFQMYKEIYLKERRQEEDVAHFGEFTSLQSREHVVHTERAKRKFLSIYDNKRYWLDANHSLPHGHYSFKHEIEIVQAALEEEAARRPQRQRPPFKRRDMLMEERCQLRQTRIGEYFESCERENFTAPTSAQTPSLLRQTSMDDYLAIAPKRRRKRPPIIDDSDASLPLESGAVDDDDDDDDDSGRPVVKRARSQCLSDECVNAIFDEMFP